MTDPTAQPDEDYRIPRVPKGMIPQNFQDPATGKLLTMTLALMEELSVTYDRVDTLEHLLVQSGHLNEGAVDTFLPDEQIAQKRAIRRKEFLARSMRAITEELRNLEKHDTGYADKELL